MNPILKVLLGTTLVCLSLYFFVAEFLGTTEALNESLDLKSLAHTRSEDIEHKAEPKPETVLAPDNRNEAAPERGDGVRIDKTTVNASSAKLDGESGDAGNGDIVASGASEDTDDRSSKEVATSKPPPPVRAVDVSLEIPSECDASGILLAPISVKYRHGSPSIRGASLADLEMLVAEYRRCDGGIFHLSHNPLGKGDATPALMQRRLDEIKYFFLQHRVPKAALRFPEIHD